MMEDWNYEVRVVHDDYTVIAQWCEQHIGPFGQDWYRLGNDIAMMVFEHNVGTMYYFRQAEHAVLFRLMWA